MELTKASPQISTAHEEPLVIGRDYQNGYLQALCSAKSLCGLEGSSTAVRPTVVKHAFINKSEDSVGREFSPTTLATALVLVRSRVATPPVEDVQVVQFWQRKTQRHVSASMLVWDRVVTVGPSYSVGWT